MEKNCEIFQDDLVTLLYEGETVEQGLNDHVKKCPSCSRTLEDYRRLQGLYQTLPDSNPPSALSEKVLSRLSRPRLVFWGSFSRWTASRRWLAHPAVVAVSVFLITLGGTFLYKKFFPSFPQGTSVALKSPTPSFLIRGDSVEEMLPVAMAPALNPNLRLIDWNTMPQLDPTLDRPVLKHANMTNLEDAAIEAVASFKHQVAMRHILDGEYTQACKVLDSVIDNYFNYSHWEQAVLLHISVMKKLGRQNEIQRDLNRLREYAMASPDAIAMIESEIR